MAPMAPSNGKAGSTSSKRLRKAVKPNTCGLTTASSTYSPPIRTAAFTCWYRRMAFPVQEEFTGSVFNPNNRSQSKIKSYEYQTNHCRSLHLRPFNHDTCADPRRFQTERRPGSFGPKEISVQRRVHRQFFGQFPALQPQNGRYQRWVCKQRANREDQSFARRGTGYPKCHAATD